MKNVYSCAESVFPNYLTTEGGMADSIKDHKPFQYELTGSEKQLPTVTFQGLGRAPHPLSPLLSPPPTSQQQQTSLRAQHSPLQSVLPTPDPP